MQELVGSGPFRIIELHAENVKRLKALTITPTGDVVRITGENAQGKTRVLDSILYACQGAGSLPPQPIRKGEKRALIKLDLGEIIVERIITPKSNLLQITAKDGHRFSSPQKLLDSLVGALSFDPLDFARMEARKQYDALKGLVKLDIDLEQLAAENKADYDERTDVNRRAKQIRGQIAGITLPMDLPAEKVDTAAILDQIENAGELNASLDARKRKRESDARVAQSNRDQAATFRAHAEDLRRQVEEAEETALRLVHDAATIEQKLAEAAPIPPGVDIGQLRGELNRAEAINSSIEDRVERDKLEQQAGELEQLALDLTERMDERERKKQAAIAAAKMPIIGLSFGEGTVLYNNVPLEQASSAEQLKVGLSIAIAMNPRLRVIRIQDGSLLDKTSLSYVYELADRYDFQIWMETVSGDIGITIEDGEVAAIDGRPVVKEATT